MKKFLTLALCLIVALFSVGCTFSTTVNLKMDSIQPWNASTNYEQCVYHVTKLDAKGVIKGEGKLILTATVDPDTYSSSRTTVDTYFEFTDSITRQTDTITSSSTFLTSSCVAISSEKTVQLRSDPELNYKFVANYDKRTVDYYIKDSTKITKTLSIPSSEKVSFDNEALYYITRAFNPTEESEGNFLLTNLYDCYQSNKVSSYSVYYRASNAYITANDFVDSCKDTAWNLISKNALIVDNKLECHHAKINRNRSNMSGAPIEMWFTRSPFIGTSRNARVMVKMKATTLTIPDASVDYTLEYDLVDYLVKQ